MARRTQGIGAIVNLYDFSSRYCSPRVSLPSPSLSSPLHQRFLEAIFRGGRGEKNRLTRKRIIHASEKLAAQFISRPALSHCAIAKISRTVQSSATVRHFAERTICSICMRILVRVSAFSRQVIIIQGTRGSSLTSLLRLEGRNNRLN